MSLAKLRRRIERQNARDIDAYERRRERDAREWEPRRAQALRWIRLMEHPPMIVNTKASPCLATAPARPAGEG